MLKWIAGFLVVAAGVFCGLYLYEQFTVNRANSALDDLHKKDLQTADDAVKEYYAVAGQGDPKKLCLQAKLVAAAYLQAGREADYVQWNQNAASDCRNARSR